jgi:hypothetical protein
MRDLKASSNVPTRLEVRIRMPTLYSRTRRYTETRAFSCRSPRPRSSRTTICFVKEHNFSGISLG